MPYYPSAAATGRGSTVVQRLVPLAGAVGHVDLFSRLATCPLGQSWEMKTFWMQNNHDTLTYRLNLSLVGEDWIGDISSSHLAVFRELILKPKQLLVMNATLGIPGGTSLWGYQLEDSAGLPDPNGISMTITGVEVR